MPAHPDEERLVESATRGDEAALSHLLLWYYDPLCRHVATQMSGDDRRRFDAEDIVQDSHTKAFRGLATFRSQGVGAFFGWLMKVADHALADTRRRHNRQRRSGTYRRIEGDHAASLTLILNSLSSDSASPSVAVARDEAVHVLREAVLELSERDRQIVAWKCFEGLSDREIADRLDSTEGAVRGICHRARKQLARQLGNPSRYFDS